MSEFCENPSVVLMMILTGIVVALAFYAFFVWVVPMVGSLSTAHDECVEECARENLNSSDGPRCFCGGMIVTCGIAACGMAGLS